MYTVIREKFERIVAENDLLEFLEGYRGARIALVEFQPVHARRCSERGELKILDMDPENIGEEKFGVVVLDGGADAEAVVRSGACYGNNSR